MKLFIALLLPILALGQWYERASPNLQRILELSSSQWLKIEDLKRAWSDYRGQKLDRLEQVNKELVEERLRPIIDPNALGVRYYEIAAICQESTSRFASHRQDLRAVLTQQQQAKLTQLENNLNLLPPIAEAQEISLLGSTVKDPIQPDPDNKTSWRVSQTTSEPNLPGCLASDQSQMIILSAGIPSPSELYPNLIRYLGLSNSQIRIIQLATARFNADVATSYVEVGAIERDMKTESALPTPRISLLGEKASRLEQICRESIGLRNGIEKALLLILLPGQLEFWQALERARELLPVILESQQLRLSSLANTNALQPLRFSLFPTRSIEWSVQAKAGPDLPGCGTVQPRTVLVGFAIFDFLPI